VSGLLTSSAVIKTENPSNDVTKNWASSTTATTAACTEEKGRYGAATVKITNAEDSLLVRRGTSPNSARIGDRVTVRFSNRVRNRDKPYLWLPWTLAVVAHGYDGSEPDQIQTSPSDQSP